MILDYHVEYALQNGYKVFRDNQAAFDYLFEDLGVSAVVRAEWWAAFKNSPPTIGSSFKRGTDKFPLILVKPQSDDPEERPMGDQVFKDPRDNLMVGQELINENVSIALIAQSPTLCRIWYAVISHILFTSARAFIAAGYDDFVRASADDFTMDDEELGEQYGLAPVTTRTIQVQGRRMANYKYWGNAITAKSWFTLASDQTTLDGHPGGVVPSSGT